MSHSLAQTTQIEDLEIITTIIKAFASKHTDLPTYLPFHLYSS